MLAQHGGVACSANTGRFDHNSDDSSQGMLVSNRLVVNDMHTVLVDVTETLFVAVIYTLIFMTHKMLILTVR